MAAQEESPFRGLVTSWPALAAMAITVLSFLAARPNLESPRPTAVGVAPRAEFRGFDVQVRLWQDPLGSVLNGPFQGRQENLTNGMPGPTDGTDGFLVLLAHVDMDLTAEQVETRRRERFATLAALNTAGYVPVKSERISYVDFVHAATGDAATPSSRYVSQAQSKNLMPQLWKTAAPAKKTLEKGAKDGPPADANDSRLRVAFEWLRPLRQDETIRNSAAVPKYRGVCVVWVWDDLDPENSLRSLMVLRDRIARTLEDAKHGGARCHFAITGRISSSRLADMRKDDAHLGSDRRYQVGLQDVPLYVTSSTARSVRKADTDELLTNSKLHVKYVIGSDDLLLNELVGELANRGVSKAGHDIALIAEWDTAYGREMHQEFLKAAGYPKDTSNSVSRPANVFLYSYLRGLDGKLPVTTEAAAEDKPATKDANALSSAGEKHGAVVGEGDAQVDYLRRLVDAMKSGRQRFRAIGVLGSDPYDKLLILRALRPHFPAAVLFTTDLDVRLVQPTEFSATRNLVIAAHFGEVLHENLQGKIPPFRSSYDTSSYLGCLLAVKCPVFADVKTDAKAPAGKTNVHALVLPDNRTMPLPVHLYEVGRFGAFELSSYTRDEDPLGARNYRRDRTHFAETWWKLCIVPVCVALLALLLATVSRSWQRLLLLQPRKGPRADKETSTRWRGGLFVAALVAVPLLIAAILYAHYHPHQEPFSMVEGLSLWPTIVFRWFAIGLCLYYGFKTLEDLAHQNTDVRQDFGFAEPSGNVIASIADRRWLPARLRATVGMWFWSPNDQTESVPEVWQQFEELGKPRHQVVRCLMILAANLVLFLLLYALLDTTVFRGRGGLARWTGRISLDLAGIALVSLLILVVDATVASFRFVTYLSRYRGRWPDPLVAKHASERDLKVTDGMESRARQAINELLRIRLIAAATQVVSRAIFDPFVVLLVMIVAQSPLFVAWQWNIPTLSVGFLSASVALVCALILQRGAKQARTNAIAALDRLLLPLAGKDNEETREKVLQIRTEISDIDTGVYAGFAQNPIIYALMLPLGGGGGLAALQALLPQP